MSITYELDGPGWARARLADERQSVDLTASYIPEALGNLATAVLQGYGVREYGEKWVEFPFPARGGRVGQLGERLPRPLHALASTGRSSAAPTSSGSSPTPTPCCACQPAS